jgi:Fe-S-cluster-containing hydrogenase component 2
MGRNVTKSPDPSYLIGQLCGIAHQGWSVERALRREVWDYLRLKAHPAKCTGCELCLTACVAQHESGAYGTNLSRLRIVEGKKVGEHRVMFCTLCGKCLDVCPTEALRWHPETGAVELLVERCNACDECVQVCPTGVILPSDDGIELASGEILDWFPIVCDLCGGEPECSRICPTGAIFVAERKEVIG